MENLTATKITEFASYVEQCLDVSVSFSWTAYGFVGSINYAIEPFKTTPSYDLNVVFKELGDHVTVLITSKLEKLKAEVELKENVLQKMNQLLKDIKNITG